MADRYTTDAGAVDTAGNWDGDTLPVAGDIANVIHAVTIDRGGAFPATGIVGFY